MAQACGLKQILGALTRLVNDPTGVLPIGAEQADIRMGLVGNPAQDSGPLIGA